MSVRIEADIIAGSVEVNREVHHTIAETGKEQLPAVLVEAANAVLLSYGLPPTIRLSTPLSRLIEEGKQTTPRGGW